MIKSTMLVWRKAYLRAMWEFMEWLSDLLTHLAGWYRDRYQKLASNPLRGRMVRWIRTTSDMGVDTDDKTVGVVRRLYHDTHAGSRGPQPYVEVHLEDGKTICMALSQFYENPDDGALEYRY